MKANTITLTFIVFITTFILCSSINLFSQKNKIQANFQLTAKKIKLIGSFLSASLKKSDGTWNKDVKLDLNNYIYNKEGSLKWGGSNFFLSCKNCKLSKAKLTCSCKNSAGKYSKSTLNLAEKISNINGSFSFDK